MVPPLIVIPGAPAWANVVETRAGDGFRVVRYLERDRYVARLADDGAALVLADGADPDWRFWTTTPKTSPATRRVPVIVVADDAAVRAAALEAGADDACAPADLPAALPRLLAGMARVFDPALAARLDDQCAEPMPPEGVAAIAKFNAGEYYPQHDLFEALWMAEPGPVRDLYRAILQVGIAYYQITRGNGRGAHKMLLRSVQWFALLPDRCRGVDVARLKADASAVRAELERLSPDGIVHFDRSLLKSIVYDSDAHE